MEKRRDFTCYAEVTLLDGTVLTLTEDDFTVDNNSIVESSGDSGIPLGVAICKTIQIELANRDEKFSRYDFFGAKIVFKTKFELSETTEPIEEGIFTVLDPYTYGETIIITALDNMYKANAYYATELVFPATLKDMLQDICSTYDIPIGTTTFLNDDFVIDARPEGNYIVRNLIGYIAMIAGGNARINRQGELEIVSYDFSVMDAILDGGTFEPWTTGDTVDGGTMEPWSEGEEVSGGSYVGLQPYHILKNFSELKVDTDDVIITGVQMEVETEDGTTELLVGEKGYVIAVENPLISGKEQEALELIGSVLIGGQMRRFEGTHIAYPLAEFMDGCIVVDRRGNAYPTILTDVNFVYFDFTTLKNAAESPTAKGINYSSGYTKAIIEAKKLVEKEKSDRELAVEQLENKLTNASGLYVTTEEQEDGSIIYYMHDKPTLAESEIVWKYTSQAFGVSTDGGVNYSYGFSATGETIARLLYAEGINADYITTGEIKDKTEKNRWNLNTGEFVAGNATINGKLISHSANRTCYINNGQIILYPEKVDDPSTWEGDNASAISWNNLFIYGGGYFDSNLDVNGELTQKGYRVMNSRYLNSYWGMMTPDASDDSWIRTTSLGIIPYQSQAGGASSLGTDSWRFGDIYGVRGNFSGLLVASTLQAGNTTTNGGLELYHATPFIDFHFGRNTTDYTSRIIEYESGKIRFACSGLDLASRCIIPPDGTAGIRGSGDDVYACGHSSYRWTAVYAKNGTIQTSDEREKDFISNFDLEDLSDFYMSLKPKAFKWKDGDDKKIHFGLGAQTTEERMIKNGYNPDDFSLIRHDKLEEESALGLTDRYSMDYQAVNILTMVQTQKNVMAINEIMRKLEEIERENVQ